MRSLSLVLAFMWKSSLPYVHIFTLMPGHSPRAAPHWHSHTAHSPMDDLDSRMPPGLAEAVPALGSYLPS